MVTLKWNTRVVLLVLNRIYFQRKGSARCTLRCIENSHWGPELSYTRRVKTVLLSCGILLCLINNGDFIHILTCCLLNVTFYVDIVQRSRMRTAYGGSSSVYLTLPDDGWPGPKHAVVCNKRLLY